MFITPYEVFGLYIGEMNHAFYRSMWDTWFDNDIIHRTAARDFALSYLCL